MNEKTISTEIEETKKDNTYTVEIDKNVFHVISKFQGTETASQMLYDSAVKRIIYDNSV